MSNVVDLQDYKYTKIAREFMKLRASSPIDAARYAQSVVSKDEYELLNEYIRAELSRDTGLEGE